MKKKTWGIILVIIGVMAILGSVANGSFANYFKYGVGISEITTIVLEIAFVVGGIRLISKSE